VDSRLSGAACLPGVPTRSEHEIRAGDLHYNAAYPLCFMYGTGRGCTERSCQKIHDINDKTVCRFGARRPT
jgi:hypothetical protein